MQRQSQRRFCGTVPSQAAPEKRGGEEIYVTDIASFGGELIGYSLSTLQQNYWTSAELDEAQGIAVDRKGAVYVANTYRYDILKFVPPQTVPVQKIKDPKFRPTDVALDSKGNIWVANWCTSTNACAPGNVSEYTNAGKLLHEITCRNLMRYTFLAVDKKDNVVVAGGGTSYGDADEIRANTTKCIELPNVHLSSAGGVQFLNNGNVTFMEQLDNVMYTYAKPAFSKLVATTTFYGVQYLSVAAFEPGDQYFFASSGGGQDVWEFAYPAGGTPLRSLGYIYFPAGVAIGPSASGD